MLKQLHAISGGGRTYWGYLSLVALSAILQAVAVLLLFPVNYELFAGDGNPAQAGKWVAALLVVIAMAWGCDIFAARLGLTLGLNIMWMIYRHAPAALTAWPDARFTPAKAANLRSLVSTKAVDTTSGVVLMVTPIITAVVFTFALGLGLIVVSPLVAAITLIGGALMQAALWGSARLEARSQARYSQATEELDDRLFEFAWAQPSLRTARGTSIGAQLVDNAIATTHRRLLGLLLWQIPTAILFSFVLQLVLLGFGVTAWASFQNGVIDATAAATLVIVLLRVVEQVTTVSGSVEGMLAMTSAAADVKELMDTKPIVNSEPMSEPPTVTLDRLTVTYPDGTPGLHEASAVMRPGTITAVVGRSGSGKTTLVRALAGIIPPTSGSISLGEVPASIGELRGNATMVFQQSTLGDGTIRDNLLAINPSLTSDDIDGLAEKAQLTTVVARLTHGWDTPVGELGAQLSGGERQRVGIARSLAKPAHVLLVDEATSALDPQNERAIVSTLDQIRADYTTVVITHRPAMIGIADQVIVMDNASIIEAGPPQELERAGGEFARIMAEWRASAVWRV